MKVVNWRGNEGNCAQDYINGTGKDVSTDDMFKEYNKNINAVIRKVYGTMASAYGKIVDSKRKIDATDAEIESLSSQLAKARSDIQMAGANKNNNLQELIERKMKEYIEASKPYTEQQIEDAKSAANTAGAKCKDAGSSVDVNAIRERVMASKGATGAVAVAAKGIIDFYSQNYGEFPADANSGGWTAEFYNMYEGVVAKVQEDPTVNERVFNEGYTQQGVLDKFERSYKKNPHKILKMLVYLLCFPIAIQRYKYREPSWMKAISNIISDIKNDNNRGAIIIQLCLWVLQWFALFYLKPVYICIFGVIVVTLAVAFYFSKKKIIDIVREMVEIDICCTGAIGSIDDQIREEVAAEVEREKASLVAEFNRLKAIYENMVNSNNKAIEDARNSFDPNNIDKGELESEYRKLITEMKTRVGEIENRIKLCQEHKNKLIEDNRPLLLGYEESKNVIKRQLSSDTEEDAFTVNGKPFNFVFGQLDAQSILKSTGVINSLGMPVTLSGRLANDAEVLGDIKSDMPPATIPINLKPVSKEDIQKICSEYGWYENVYTEMCTIMAGVDQELRQAINKMGADTEGLDFSKFYKFTIVEHGLRCAVMFYNSKDDVNSRKTVADVCTHNIIHPTVCTTDMRGLSFRIFPNDRTSFDAMDYGLGASIEERNSMASNHFYEVYDASDRDKIVSELYSSALGMAKEIGSSSRNIVEYRAKKMNGGSSPTRITYLIFTDDVERYWSDTLRSILYGTGGTQTGGHDASGENTYGIVPILFLDLAPLLVEKPDTSAINRIEEVSKAIAVKNFFYVGSGAESIKKFDRKEVQTLVDKARTRAR